MQGQHGRKLGNPARRIEQLLMEKETARIEAFSDGVFAIAITLLILEIKIPTAGSGNLTGQLLRQWPSYFAFVFSFAFVGIMWINHHRLFTHIKRSNNALLFLNLLLLLGVTAVPFPTAVLAQYLGKSDQRAAAILYHGTYFCIAVFFNILWRYANRHLLGDHVDAAATDKISAKYAVGPILYLVCIALTWVSVPVSLLLNVALAVFFALPLHRALRVVGK
jgi:uncharacterized membrane protein